MLVRWNKSAPMSALSSQILQYLISGLIRCLQSIDSDVQLQALFCLQLVLNRNIGLRANNSMHLMSVLVSDVFISKQPDTIMESMKCGRLLLRHYAIDVIPVLVKAIDSKDLSAALQCVECIAKSLGEEIKFPAVPLSIVASIIDPLIRAVTNGKPKLRTAALKPLRTALQLWPAEIRVIIEGAEEGLKGEQVCE